MNAVYDESHAEAVADHFDGEYYLDAYPDVRESGMDPLVHFLACGWREGRNPSRSFDISYYQQVNSDVVAAGINPLVHYVLAGAREGRLPQRPLHARRQHLEGARAPSAKAADWAGAADRSPSLEREAVARYLTAAIIKSAGLVLSVSHDDYEAKGNLGGVQNVIREERFAFERNGWGYLHLSPAAPLPMLAATANMEEFRFRLRLGPDWLGVATAADMMACLTELRGSGTRLLLVVHHMMGHAPEILQGLADIVAEPMVTWAHDYFTLCPNHNLLRNDVQFCGAPPVDSAACGVCTYGAERVEQQERVRALFEATRPVVLAPSAMALGLWQTRGRLPHREAHAQPLARLVLSPEVLGPADAEPARPLRVAHLGMRMLHKGWPVFEALALRFAKDPAYAFYQLGLPQSAPLPGCIRNVDVRVNHERPDAMVEAIAEHGIDVVVSWSPWPETFCYAVHEALAGGAFVIARAGAGNVGPAIVENAPHQGCVIADEAALFALFETGRIKELLRTSCRRRGALISESGTVGWFRRASQSLLRPLDSKPFTSPMPPPERLIATNV